MKRYFLFFIIASMSLLMASCEDHSNPDWTEQYKENYFYVVKFNPFAAVYRDNVMMVTDKDGKYYMRSLNNGGTCREFFMGKSPFIEIDKTILDTVEYTAIRRIDTINLVDTFKLDTILYDTIRVDTLHHGGWYLVDWKWGLELRYTHVVLPMMWKDVRKPDEKYYRSDFQVITSDIISKIGVVKRSEIDKLMHITPAPAAEGPGPWGRTSGGISTDYLAPVYLSRYYSKQDLPEVIDQKGDWQYTLQDYIDERQRQDSLQEIYRQRLATLLYSGMVNSIVTVIDK